MNCKLEQLYKDMPQPFAEHQKYAHIIVHQNQEIIRLLEKIAGEGVIEEVKETVPKKKRAKRGTLLPVDHNNDAVEI